MEKLYSSANNRTKPECLRGVLGHATARQRVTRVIVCTSVHQRNRYYTTPPNRLSIANSKKRIPSATLPRSLTAAHQHLRNARAGSGTGADAPRLRPPLGGTPASLAPDQAPPTRLREPLTGLPPAAGGAVGARCGPLAPGPFASTSIHGPPACTRRQLAAQAEGPVLTK